MAAAPRLIPLKVAAPLLGMSVWKLRQECRARRISYVLNGSRYLIPASELEAYPRRFTVPARVAARPMAVTKEVDIERPEVTPSHSRLIDLEALYRQPNNGNETALTS